MVIDCDTQPESHSQSEAAVSWRGNRSPQKHDDAKLTGQHLPMGSKSWTSIFQGYSRLDAISKSLNSFWCFDGQNHPCAWKNHANRIRETINVTIFWEYGKTSCAGHGFPYLYCLVKSKEVRCITHGSRFLGPTVGFTSSEAATGDVTPQWPAHKKGFNLR